MASTLDPRLRARLAAATENKRRERVAVLVKLAPGHAPSRLVEFGFAGGAAFGDIVTGSIPLEAIEQLAASDAVVYIEASSALGYDPEQ